MAAIPLGRNVTYRPGVKMVKFATAPTTYAVALGGVLRPIKDEAAASVLYGADWNTKIDDVSDAFFPDYRFGAPVTSGNDYAPSEELAWADDIDDDLPKTRRDIDVVTPAGTFRTEIVSLHRDHFIMRTSVAGSPNCSSDCDAFDLRTHAERFGADIGMHGSYFCPPDYTGCGGTNTFLSPFFDSLTGIMSNENSLNVHKGPVAAVSDDGSWRFFRTARDFGSDVTTFEATYGTELVAAASNYPALIEDGAVVVLDEPRYEDPMKTEAVRAGFGWDERFIRLAVVRSASVLDLAHVLAELGSAYALNMDGGGSTALLYDDAYLFGPGRGLPNAMLFVERP
jgi:hypothetical protein